MTDCAARTKEAQLENAGAPGEWNAFDQAWPSLLIKETSHANARNTNQANSTKAKRENSCLLSETKFQESNLDGCLQLSGAEENDELTTFLHRVHCQSIRSQACITGYDASLEFKYVTFER